MVAAFFMLWANNLMFLSVNLCTIYDLSIKSIIFVKYMEIMKNIFWLISFSFFFLLGMMEVKSEPFQQMEGEEEYILQDNPSADNLAVLSISFPEKNTSYMDATLLAWQLQASARGQRQLSYPFTCLAKGNAFRIAKLRLEALLHPTNPVYNSLPFISWSVSADHYVYGMRRIII